MANQAVTRDSLIGQTLGHYGIVEKIGAGGMGEVYRAHDEHLNRDVAIKVLPRGTLADRASRKQFRKEALALSKLNHPSIAIIHDFDRQDSVEFLVMEYVRGVNLSEILTARGLPENKLIRFGEQLAAGLAAAHSQGIVHCDLKPGNLRVSLGDRLKILDFGLAKLREPEADESDTETVTATRGPAGTFPYMAPEQLGGEPPDARCDIWAAGVVLYEMATGRLPFLEKVPTATIDAILHKSCRSPIDLRPSLSPHLANIILKCLEKQPENRYQSAAELAVDFHRLRRDSDSSPISSDATIEAKSPFLASRWKFSLLAVLLLAAATVGLLLLFHPRTRAAQPITERDTIMLADFTNRTGDPVFDDALKQALAVDLEQSPFLNILSDAKVQQTLHLMGRSPEERITAKLGQELCQRAGSKALVSASIVSLGAQYVIGVRAAECNTGNHLASEQIQAVNKEDVLKALSKAAARLRSKLGESLTSVQKFDAPIEEVTTPSLEALKAYSLGLKASNRGTLDAIPFFERAIELDPNFAMAYASLAVMHSDLGKRRLAHSPELAKAFALRDRVSERERFRISALYYTGINPELAIPVYQQWAQTYPTDVIPHLNLGAFLDTLGRWEAAVAETQEALRLDPNNSVPYSNLALYLIALNKTDDAEATIKDATSRGIGASWLRLPMYHLAFLRGDARKMEQLLQGALGNEDETWLLAAQSSTEVYYGRLVRARSYSRHALESAFRVGSTSWAAAWQAHSAVREAELGNPATARQAAASSLSQDPIVAALALARIGDIARAKALAEEVEKAKPLDPRMTAYWLPTLRAAIELNESRPAQAITLLEKTIPYELGALSPEYGVGPLYPAYLRGHAYLMLHDAAAAATEFQKLLDHRGLVLNHPLGALARLQLGRAYAMLGDMTKAKAAYQDFLTLWKEADPDIPILKQAKAEYARLQ